MAPRVRLFILITVGGLALISGATAVADTASEARAIALEFDRMQHAVQTRDSLSIGVFYSDSALSLLANRPMQRGREAIVRRWKSTFAFGFVVRATGHEIHVSPGLEDAFQIASFAVFPADTAAHPVATGNLLLLWRKDHERWKVAVEMDNSGSATARVK